MGHPQPLQRQKRTVLGPAGQDATEDEGDLRKEKNPDQNVMPGS